MLEEYGMKYPMVYYLAARIAKKTHDFYNTELLLKKALNSTYSNFKKE